MVDNSAAKSRLNAISEALDRRNMSELDSIVFKRSMDLYSCLSEETLYVDDTIKTKLQEVYSKLHAPEATPWSIRHYLRQRINTLNTAIADPGTKAKDKPALQRERDDYENRLNGINAREGNYNNLITNANKFKNDTLDNLDFNINAAIPRGVWAWTVAIDLDSKFLMAGWTTVDDYVLCDKDWNKLNSTANVSWWRDYKINIWWVEHTLVDVRIIWAVGSKQLDCSHMTITPPLSSFPKEIDLSINGVFNSVTVWAWDINVVCNKNFKLKLNDWIISLDDAARLVEFNNYNDALPAGHKIENIVATVFNGNRHSLERKALAKILEKNWWTQYATLTDWQKEDFYQRIRNMTVAGALYFDNLLTSELIDTDIRMFNEFRSWFIHDDRDRNKGDNVKSNHNYVTYIHNNVSQKVWDFVSNRLDHFLWDITQETLLKSELTRYINEIENNKLDTDNDIYNDVNGYASQPSHQMDRKNHWYQFWRDSDAHYMRFFSWSSTSLKGEVVNIHTNTDPESVGVAEPLKYDMDVKISWTNNIEVEIKIERERDPIRIKSWDPAALVRKIMRDCRIRYWKARAHMWFNIYKAMVKMAKDNDISLQYRDGSDHTRYIDINDGNILIREVDDLVRLWRWEWRVIFDQERFINSNEFANFWENRSLRSGIDELWKHFTLAMNQLHNQYRHWVEKKFWTLFSSRSKMNLPTSFWSSPIKKLLNLKNTTNFDFNTNVTSKWKNVSIDFQKNKFTLNMAWLDKPIESKDLWKILNKRQKGIRIFDGIERDIVEWVYVALIAKLRENTKIANTDFWVMDNITWNMYVLDRDWRFWVIARENLNSQWSPLWSWEYGRLNHRRLESNTVDWFEHWGSEEKELMKNPFLMQRLVKAMNNRMWLWWSISALFN